MDGHVILLKPSIAAVKHPATIKSSYMLHIVQRNVRSLRQGLAGRDPNAHVLQVPVRARQHRQLQRLVLLALRRAAQAHGRHLGAVDVEAGHGHGAALRQVLGGAGVGAEAEVEGLEIEGRPAGPAPQLRVRVERELPELEQVDGAGGADLLGLGVRDHIGKTLN